MIWKAREVWSPANSLEMELVGEAVQLRQQVGDVESGPPWRTIMGTPRPTSRQSNPAP
jgi:hypothetical protein